jgi:hypothetical protein
MKRLLVHSLWIVLLLAQSAWAQRVVLYPNLDGLGAQAIGFQVLELALKKSKTSMRANVANTPPVNGTRARLMLAAGEIQVVDIGFSPDVESNLEPLYLPIDRGVLGWRIFVIHKDNQANFSRIQTLKDLQAKSAGQGNNWSDVAILEHAGIKVRTAAVIADAMLLTDSKSVDFFPLGANEAHSFLEKYGSRSKDLVVENELVLVYPFGRFFYLKKGDTELKNALQSGMETALADGSLQKLLESHAMFKDAFTRARLKDRRVIRIELPKTTEGFRNIDKKWWLKLAR